MDRFKLQPARDLEVPVHRRRGDVRRETGHVGWLMQCMTTAILRCYLKLYHRVKIEGIDHLPTDAPYVLIANHASHMDTLLLSTLVPARLRGRVFPLAAGDFFFESRPRAAVFTVLLNLLPIRRKAADRHALEHLRLRLIEDGLVYLVYPEGTRGDGEKIAPFKPGIGMMVAGTTVPVVPCYLSGCNEALGKGRWLPRPCRVGVRLGAPLTFEAHKNRRASWCEIAGQLHTAVGCLKDSSG